MTKRYFLFHPREKYVLGIQGTLNGMIFDSALTLLKYKMCKGSIEEMNYLANLKGTKRPKNIIFP